MTQSKYFAADHGEVDEHARLDSRARSNKVSMARRTSNSVDAGDLGSKFPLRKPPFEGLAGATSYCGARMLESEARTLCEQSL